MTGCLPFAATSTAGSPFKNTMPLLAIRPCVRQLLLLFASIQNSSSTEARNSIPDADAPLIIIMAGEAPGMYSNRGYSRQQIIEILQLTL